MVIENTQFDQKREICDVVNLFLLNTLSVSKCACNLLNRQHWIRFTHPTHTLFGSEKKKNNTESIFYNKKTFEKLISRRNTAPHCYRAGRETRAGVMDNDTIAYYEIVFFREYIFATTCAVLGRSTTIDDPDGIWLVCGDAAARRRLLLSRRRARE